MQFPAVLREIRRFDKATQADVARRASIDFWRYNRIERGLLRPTSEEKQRLILALPTLGRLLDEKRRAI